LLTSEARRIAVDFARRLPLAELAVASIFFLVAVAAIVVTRTSGEAALIWPANAIASALLVRLASVRWMSAFALLVLAGTLANMLAAADLLASAVGMTCVNVTEIAVTTRVLRFWRRFPVPNLTLADGIRMATLFAFVIPALTALPGGFVIHAGVGTPLGAAICDWWMSSALGACLCGPAIYLYSTKAAKGLCSRESFARNLALVLASLVIPALSIRLVRFPFAVIVVPLIIAAFRMGAFGSAVLCAMSGFAVIGLWAVGIRPMGLGYIEHAAPVAGLPFLSLAAILLAPIAVGLATEERRLALRALRFNERRFRESLEHSPLGMILMDLEGHWTLTNAALQKMLGYSAEEIQALSSAGIVHPEDREDIRRRTGMLQRGEIESYGAERRYRHKNGSWIWVHVAASLVRDEDGTPLHYFSQIESLEARRQAERDLAEEKQRLQTTLRVIAEAVITTDSVGQLTYANAAAEELIGQPYELIAGRRLDEVMVLTDPQSSKVTTAVLARCIARGEVVRRQEPCILHRPDGDARYVIDVASPVCGEDGRLTGAVVVLRDATARYTRERELSHRATHDGLTGLANRVELERRARECFKRARHLDRPAAVLMIDLDGFKEVNDHGGHAAGDAMLCAVANALRTAAGMRETAVVARFGGDEFAVLLEGCDTPRALTVSRKILGAVQDIRLEWNGTVYSIGASIGAAATSPSFTSVRDWIAAADAACYQAKRSGRGQICAAPTAFPQASKAG
jgi:diguanylate cyclase (GGDEF)-like protein/PAS domain S-box-containing protein